MTSSLRRALRALVRGASSVLTVIAMLALVLPPASAAGPPPKIVSVDVSGNVHVPTDRILAVVRARPGDSYDPAVVQQDLANIFALGYFADQVPPLIRQRPGGVAITYRVIENPVITRIVFTGNAHVTSDSLLALMDTSVGQVLNSNTFHEDVLKINSYYDRIGYRGQLPTHVKDLNIDPQTGVLTLTIQEGLTVRQVLISGDPLLPPTVILPILAVKPGVPYSEEERDKDIDAVKKLYDKYDLVLGDFEGGIDASTIDLKNYTADVRYTIDVARVAAIEITGNTKTKDQVIRRELRLKPGMVLTQPAVRADYERLNRTGFFSKVEPNVKPGPDPKKPADVTIVWTVTEQRTATATVGAGYSGGISGQGLYATLGVSDNNLNGTGNGGSVQVQRGSRNYLAQAQISIPYVGKTKQSQRYSLGATIFTQGQTNYYPIYQTSSASTFASPPPGANTNVPVTIFPSTGSTAISGVVSTSISKSAGITVQVGRWLSDYTKGYVGAGVSRVSTDTTVPAPYYFQSGQPNLSVFVGPTPNPITGSQPVNGSFGINAPSIANINTGQPYKLNTVNLGVTTDTRDDIFNPTRGHNVSLAEELSAPGIGSDFQYSKTTLDMIRFFPQKEGATVGLHGQLGYSTGALPPNDLFTYSDQQVRGYNSVFYGTNALLGQAEYRHPILSDRKLVLALFIDELGYKIRGAPPLLDPYTNRIIGYPGNVTWRGDAGFGVRFDLPQLGLHTVRLDFARGSQGTHLSFGIGQSF
ncbi:MAG: BamA/TamA family outer membrane protein [Candidatus Eremiobacteraeota bacterium]|nr:BamA/TamA family outer membrane protein [Candidatus Eremiobacteraeota bacterium]